MRQRVVGVLAIMVLSAPLLATSACDFSACWDPDPDCGRRGGHIDRATCNCVGQSYGYPPSYAPPPGCTSDSACRAPAHCMGNGSCEDLCVSAADCRRGATCAANGVCARACNTESDCAIGFECKDGACAWRSDRCFTSTNDHACPSDMKCESRYGIECGALCGTELCSPRFECITFLNSGAHRCEAPDYRRCTVEFDCNPALGGTCVEGKCYGPRVRVEDAGDAGPPLVDAGDAADDGDGGSELDAADSSARPTGSG